MTEKELEWQDHFPPAPLSMGKECPDHSEAEVNKDKSASLGTGHIVLLILLLLNRSKKDFHHGRLWGEVDRVGL